MKNKGQDISLSEIAEFKCMKAEQKLASYLEQVEQISDMINSKGLKNKSELNLTNRDISIEQEIKNIRNSYLVKEIFHSVVAKMQNDPYELQPKLLQSYQNEQKPTDRFNADLLRELSQYSKYIEQIKESRYQEFKDKLYSQLQRKKGVSLSYAVKEAFASVEVSVPEVSKVQKIKELAELHKIVPLSVAKAEQKENNMVKAVMQQRNSPHHKTRR